MLAKIAQTLPIQTSKEMIAYQLNAMIDLKSYWLQVNARNVVNILIQIAPTANVSKMTAISPSSH